MTTRIARLVRLVRRGRSFATALLALVSLLAVRAAPLLEQAEGGGGCCGGRCHLSCSCCSKKHGPVRECGVSPDCSPEAPSTPAGFPQVVPAVLVGSDAIRPHAPRGRSMPEITRVAPPSEPPDPPDPPPRSRA